MLTCCPNAYPTALLSKTLEIGLPNTSGETTSDLSDISLVTALICCHTMRHVTED